ncbi:MAG: DUF4139 domain-containing protein, partial [Acidobacteria bacterium]|nr:DUF4139 domain-containing protein [Acidobacteriota bacterium]
MGRGATSRGVVAVVVSAVVLALGSGGAAGCKKKVEEPPQVSSKLPIQRVVLYRNGVGYFERAGKVVGDEIKFKVRETQVGDFLASLAVVTLDGKPVEFVTFPVNKEKKDKKEETPPLPPYPCWPYMPPGACPGPTPPPDEAEAKEEEPEDQVEVVVKLKGEEGAEHDVIIAYVVESPIWRPTYRIVMDEAGKKALLQGWAVVQNLSGEDWEDVRLTVTEGAPLTFRADLGNPFIPLRPMVTDRGEVVQAAVSSSISVSEETRREMERQQMMASTTEPVMPVEEAPAPGYYPADESVMGYLGGEGYGAVALGTATQPDAARPMRRAETGASANRGSGGRYPSGGGGGPASGAAYPTVPAASTPAAPPPPPPPPQGLTAGGAQASLALLALGSQEGGITTYQAVAPVTVRDEASTLVAIFNQSVEASDTLLFRPDPGVPVSTQHPFRVVRFTNQAGVTLERGPVAIFGKETFLGQGLLEPLPTGATTSIPYAVERSVVVSVEAGSDIEEASLVKVVHGTITVRRYSVRKTKYVVQNLSERPGKLYIQHSRWSGWELRNLPEGSEEVDALTVIVPLELKAQAKAEIEVLERSPTLQEVLILTDVGRDAVRLYLSGPAVDGVAGPALAKALELAEQIGRIDADIQRFSEERDQVTQAMYETQNNLYAIEGITRAGELRTRLTTRLSDLEKRYNELQMKIIDLTAQRGELDVEIKEAIRDIELEVPEPAAAPAEPAAPAAAPSAPPAPPAPA